MKIYRKVDEVEKVKERRKEKRAETPNFLERTAKTAQVLSNLNENFFDFFDFAVKKFCESILVNSAGRKKGGGHVG
jgi:hypothetical protein